MREIKFRGKRVDNGEWVYGFYYAFLPICRIRHWLDSLNHYGDVDVVHETVGQYTGLKDKNGKEIYEGDIVKYKSVSDFYEGEEINEEVDNIISHKGVVRFIDGSFNPIPEINICDDSYYSWKTYDFEIIGNIYENPELLEVKNE